MGPNSEPRPKRKLDVRSRPPHLDTSRPATKSRDRRKRNDGVPKPARPDSKNPLPLAPISRVPPSPTPVPVPVCVPESIPAKWIHAQVFF